ncbi:hypothetical protein FocnCong_v021676 [Fusarium oxysporum f. sp. conglutinans]|nr:hypothetical protein FocnCong_v021676 [Fusarium oxysporum f. sp. conglutinans]
MVRRNYTEDDVAEAILDTTGRGLSQNEAAQKRGVPQSTLSGRLSGQASRNERIQAHQRIPKSQGRRLFVGCCDKSLWAMLSRTARSALVSRPSSNNKADNKPLGKELQKQWFLNEFELIADWHYITSPNGWTDNHIALEWLKDVYLPQTEPRDASDARLIILDGHGSHAQDEWMATCFLNNVYCCYLPAHCSHGLQPLDNGIFNVIKGAYRKELQKLASLTDSAPDDKVHFIRAYAKAREAGMRKDIILSGWRFTGNWPINRHKALTHPEIQPDKEKVPERFKTPSPPQLHSDDTPKTSRQVRDLAKHRSRPTRRKYSKMAKGLEALEMKVAVQNARITGLEEQMAQVRRGKKRKAVPDPNDDSWLWRRL